MKTHRVNYGAADTLMAIFGMRRVKGGAKLTAATEHKLTAKEMAEQSKKERVMARVLKGKRQ